jgi:hypothetical protein
MVGVEVDAAVAEDQMTAADRNRCLRAKALFPEPTILVFDRSNSESDLVRQFTLPPSSAPSSPGNSHIAQPW